MAGRASISRVQRKVSLGPDVPACGLLRLRDGSLAYIVERFDRPRTGGKRRQEDFCQLAELSPKQKYEGSAELCVRLIRRFASEPGVATLALFRLLVFGWWTGNGDMHLKNLSLLTDDDGRHQLSPAYDLLCTRLVIADDPLALPVNARKERLDRGTWLRFAEYARIPPNAAARALALPLLTLPRALDLCERSFLPDEIKAAYAELLAERGRLLANI